MGATTPSEGPAAQQEIATSPDSEGRGSVSRMEAVGIGFDGLRLCMTPMNACLSGRKGLEA